MPTFKRTEIVDARQFTGGVENGTNLALWANSNHANAAWFDHDELGPERIKLVTDDFSVCVYMTDWIILRQDGRIDHNRLQDFEAAGYTQV